MSDNVEYPISAVVFDWAGTLIDFGSRAPMDTFVQVFREFGVNISIEDAREPMGMAKLDHIKALGKMAHVANQWTQVHGTSFDDHAARRIYDRFLPINVQVVSDYGDLIGGAASTVSRLRQDGVRIGTTTGYTREVMERVIECARQQSLEVDSIVCAGDLWAGRPTPAMMWRSFIDLEVTDPASVIKVDDTPVGISEGLLAGTWTVGVVASGNETGLSLDEWQALTPQAQQQQLTRASRRLLEAGAHFVIPTVADLLDVVDIIATRLGRRTISGCRLQMR